MPASTYRAGESIEDFCRACKTDRSHTVIVVDAGGRPIRVACDYCESQHNYRGGPRIEPQLPSAPVASPHAALQTTPTATSVSRTERPAPPMPLPDRTDDLESLLRRIIREEAGLTPTMPSAKWRGGTLVLRPATSGLQEKSWPIETFFHKIVMLRNRLRTLEQQVNASDLPEDVKIKLQAYVSGCYGSLTSFNVLFAEDDDQFKGSSSD